MNDDKINEEVCLRLTVPRCKIGDFNNPAIEIDVLPKKFTASIAEWLNKKGMRLLEKNTGRFDSTVPPGFFEIQHHDCSVDDHDDDIESGVYFCVIPYEIYRLSESIFKHSPRLVSFDQFGKKQDAEMREFELIIFNPRRKHRLDYYGKAVKLMLFSVEKMK
jgi:hypothetical protein